MVYRDPETFQIKPLLAISWKQTNDTTWEFELRHGVTFHDGSPFTADDVVYTVNTVLSDPQIAVPSNYAILPAPKRLTISTSFDPETDLSSGPRIHRDDVTDMAEGVSRTCRAGGI